MKIVSHVLWVYFFLILATAPSCSPIKEGQAATGSPEIIQVNNQGNGISIEIQLFPGPAHNHPSFAIWAETMEEEFIQTLFVTKSVGTGIFGHGSLGAEKWDTKSGPQSRPASLPYWLHKRIPSGSPFYLPNPENPVPDAYTGATPLKAAKLELKTDVKPIGKFRILLEINQPWDWNEYWHTSLIDDADYRTSCQPSLIYAVTVDPSRKGQVYNLNPIGHGHPSGKTGDLDTDLSTLTTAKKIVAQAQILIK